MQRREITSPHNPKVVAAARLRDRRQRDKTGQIIIDGLREIERALRGGVAPLDIFVEHGPETARRRAIVDEAEKRGATVRYVPRFLMEKISFGGRNEGVVVVAAEPKKSLADMPSLRAPLLAVIEGVEKPGNLGAILRSADGAGVDGVLVVDGRVDIYNPNCIRASLGIVFTLPVCTVPPAAALAWLRERKTRIVAARVDAQQEFTEVDYRGPTAFVLGSEARGLSETWNTKSVTPVRIPMLGQADSLNVSVAAALLFYEALRQRRQSSAAP